MNYGEFKTQVAQYLHRGDLTSIIPTFIEYGRIRMCDDLRVREMEVTQTVTLTAGVGALSGDLLDIRSVWDTQGRELVRVNLANLNRYPTASAWAVRGLDILSPGSTDLDVTYYGRPVTFIGAADSATRDVLEAYPQVWLQAALVEAYRYLNDEQNEVLATQRMTEEIRRANAAARRSLVGASPAVDTDRISFISEAIN